MSTDSNRKGLVITVPKRRCPSRFGSKSVLLPKGQVREAIGLNEMGCLWGFQRCREFTHFSLLPDVGWGTPPSLVWIEGLCLLAPTPIGVFTCNGKSLLSSDRLFRTFTKRQDTNVTRAVSTCKFVPQLFSFRLLRTSSAKSMFQVPNRIPGTVLSLGLPNASCLADISDARRDPVVKIRPTWFRDDGSTKSSTLALKKLSDFSASGRRVRSTKFSKVSTFAWGQESKLGTALL